jgi:hypothetical protein
MGEKMNFQFNLCAGDLDGPKPHERFAPEKRGRLAAARATKATRVKGPICYVDV